MKFDKLNIGSLVMFIGMIVLIVIVLINIFINFVSLTLISLIPFSFLIIVFGMIIAFCSDSVWSLRKSSDIIKSELITDKDGFALCEPCGMYHDESEMRYLEDTNSWICNHCMKGVV